VNCTCGFIEAPIRVFLLFTELPTFYGLPAFGFRPFTTADVEIQPVDIPRTLCASVGHSTRFPLKICRKSQTCWKILIFFRVALAPALWSAQNLYKKNSFNIPTRHI
jgi:hypothetical protein